MSDARERTCAEARDGMPLRFYDPPADGADDPIGRHLVGCAACAAEWERTRGALGQVRAAEAFPREREVDWEAFARATVARARAAEGAGLLARRRRVAAWSGLLAAAAAIVVIIAVRGPGGATRREGAAAGSGTEGSAGAGSAGLLREGVARQAAARSLREGRALLVELMQAPVRCRRGDGTLDIALEKERSRRLLRRLALHQGALTGPGDARIADLMGQVESLLLQVSALEDCAGPGSLDDLRAAVGRGQILLRIDLVTRGIDEGGARA